MKIDYQYLFIGLKFIRNNLLNITRKLYIYINDKEVDIV